MYRIHNYYLEATYMTVFHDALIIQARGFAEIKKNEVCLQNVYDKWGWGSEHF